jgi:hypothetical protein
VGLRLIYLTGLIAAPGNCKFFQEVLIFVSFHANSQNSDQLLRLNALWHPVLLAEQIHPTSLSPSSHGLTVSMFETLFRGFFFVLQVSSITMIAAAIIIIIINNMFIIINITSHISCKPPKFNLRLPAQTLHRQTIQRILNLRLLMPPFCPRRWQKQKRRRQLSEDK